MNPRIFPNPENFDPERWITAAKNGQRLNRYLVSFTRGGRQCLGMKWVPPFFLRSYRIIADRGLKAWPTQNSTLQKRQSSAASRLKFSKRQFRTWRWLMIASSRYRGWIARAFGPSLRGCLTKVSKGGEGCKVSTGYMIACRLRFGLDALASFGAVNLDPLHIAVIHQLQYCFQ